MGEKLLLSIAETAKLLSLSARTVWMMARAGEIPAVKIQHGARATWRVPVRELEAWVRERTEGGLPSTTKGGGR